MSNPYALIDAAGNVINTILWDSTTPYTPPDGLTVVANPSGAGIGWTYVNGIFNAPPAPAVSLAQAQAAAVAGLTAACGAAITGGYSSAALGTPHTYPMSQTDQINMLGSIAASTLPSGQVPGWTTPFMCADSTGAWALRPHTATQIQQAGQNGKAWVVTCQTHLAAQAAAVLAATTVADVEAITW